MTLTKDGLTRKEKRATWYQENKKRIRIKNRNNKELKEYKKEYYEHNKQRIADGLPLEGIRPDKPKLSEEEKKERIRISERKHYYSPKGKETKKKYQATAKYKAYRLEYKSRPEVKERVLAYSQENREHKNAYGREYRKVNADALNAKRRGENKTAKSVAYRKARYQRLKSEGYYLKRKLEKKALSA